MGNRLTGNKLQISFSALLLSLGLTACSDSEKSLNNDTTPTTSSSLGAIAVEENYDYTKKDKPKSRFTRIEAIRDFYDLEIDTQNIIKVQIQDANISKQGVLEFPWPEYVNQELGIVNFNPEKYNSVYTVNEPLSFDTDNDPNSKADVYYGPIGLDDGKVTVKTSSDSDSVLTVGEGGDIRGGGIIMGHRDSTSPDGAMNYFHNIKIGSIINVWLEDGTKFSFRVNVIENADKSSDDKSKFQNGLWVFTCATEEERLDGTFTTSKDKSLNAGAELVAVTAKDGHMVDLRGLGLVPVLGR